MSVNGHPGQEPARVGTSIVDMGTGMWAALGIVAALRERDRTGRAVEVTTALFETALMWVSYHAMGYLGTNEVPQPQGSGTAMIAPYQAFPTSDGYAMTDPPANLSPDRGDPAGGGSAQCSHSDGERRHRRTADEDGRHAGGGGPSAPPDYLSLGLPIRWNQERPQVRRIPLKSVGRIRGLLTERLVIGSWVVSGSSPSPLSPPETGCWPR